MPAIGEKNKSLQDHTMKARKQVPIEVLERLFLLDPVTGFLTRKCDAGKMKAGARAERVSRQYLVVKVFGYGELPAHRVVWVLTHGVWPLHDIDHINGNQRDNRPVNLRDVPHLVNLQNRRKASINSSTGFLGVSPYIHKAGKYRADIRANGKQVVIGVFDTPELAYQAYISAKRELHEGCTL